MEEERVWFFTFCLDDEKRKNCYVKFTGTYESAREKMFQKYGKHWAFQYSEEEIRKGIENFGWKEYKEIE